MVESAVETLAEQQRAAIRPYFRLTHRYLEADASRSVPIRSRYLASLVRDLPPGSTVAELGCGDGVPVTRQLAVSHSVIAVDVRRDRVEEAHRRVPSALVVQGNFLDLAVRPESLDAVVAFYGLIHAPQVEFERLVPRLATWLRADGLFVGSIGTACSLWPSRGAVPSTVTCLPIDQLRAVLGSAELQVETMESDGVRTPAGFVEFTWFRARRR